MSHEGWSRNDFVQREGEHLVKHLRELGPEELRRTVLVGHSAGCHAILHALEALQQPSEKPLEVFGVVLVAAWWALDHHPEMSQSLLKSPPDVEKVLPAVGAGGIRVLLSDYDRYTGDGRINRLMWQQNYAHRKIAVELVPSVDRFNATREPAVRDIILGMGMAAASAHLESTKVELLPEIKSGTLVAKPIRPSKLVSVSTTTTRNNTHMLLSGPLPTLAEVEE